MSLHTTLRQNQSVVIWVLALLLFSLVVGAQYLLPKFPYTHDGENHLARFANYKIALKEGQLPPRFAPNLLNRYGYPVFNYQYPLANIVSLPFSALKINYQTTFSVLVVASLLAGGGGVLLLVREYSRRYLDALIGLLVWYSSPFLWNILLYRGNIGELMAYSLFPWLFWSVHQLEGKKQLRSGMLLGIVAVTSAFLLSHNIAAVFGLPLVLVYALLRYGLSWGAWRRLLVLGFTAGLLSCWFWIPALFELSEVRLSSSENNLSYSEHFPTIGQLVYSPMQFGFSKAGSEGELSYSLGFVQWAALSFGVWGVWLARKHWKTKRARILWGVWGLGLAHTLLQLEITQPIWEIVTPLRYMQFPWRLSLFIPVLAIICLVIALPKDWKKIRLLLVMLGIIQLLLLRTAWPVDFFNKTIVDYDAFTDTSSTQKENMPKTFVYEGFATWQPAPEVISGSAAVEVGFWSGSRRRYQVIADSPVLIVEPTVYFLGWEVWARSVSSDQQSQKKQLFTPETQGRVAYALEPGTYEIESVFTQHTPARKVGNGLFLLGLMLVASLVVLPKRFLD